MSEKNDSQPASKEAVGIVQGDIENAQPEESGGAAENEAHYKNTSVSKEFESKMQKLNVKVTKENNIIVDLSDDDKGSTQDTEVKPCGKTKEELVESQEVMDSQWESNENTNNQRDASLDLQPHEASGDDGWKAGEKAEQQTSTPHTPLGDNSEQHQRAEGAPSTDTTRQSTLTAEEQKQAALAKLRNSKTNDDYDYDKHKGGFRRNQSSETELDKRFKAAEEKFTFFWKSDDVFSQWHESKFTVNKIKFTCAEQYMMYKKATLFGSDDIAKEILKTKSPRKMKSLGRQVKQFQDNTWCWHCLEVVKEASIHKYTQNKFMKEILFSTYPKILVEASPYDRIWGIGFVKKDERAWDEETWDGLNLLGFILTEVRDELMWKEKKIKDTDRMKYYWDLQDKLFKQNLENDPGTSVDIDWNPIGDWEDWKTIEYQYDPSQAGN